MFFCRLQKSTNGRRARVHLLYFAADEIFFAKRAAIITPRRLSRKIHRSKRHARDARRTQSWADNSCAPAPNSGSTQTTKTKTKMGAEDDDVGFKWSLSALRRHFDEEGLDYGAMWARCKDVITKTMMCVESKINTLIKMHVPDRRICYEVFGFDIMLDTALQPWLIEVNTGPSLSAPSAMDMHIKHRMVANLFNLVGFVPYDRARFEAEEGARRQARLTGVPTAAAAAAGKGKGAAAAASAAPKKWGKAGAAVAVLI